MDKKPTQQQVTLSAPPTLDRIDTHRVIAVIEKAVERLELLSMLDHEHGADTVAAMQTAASEEAKGVGSILDEQKELERRYEELLAATKTVKANPLEPQLDAACFSHVKNAADEQNREELKKVSKKLKETSKQLCRQLKDNPNDADNWKKITNERAQLIDLFRDCSRELATSSGAVSDVQDMTLQGSQLSSYERFARTIIQEKEVAIWAEDLVKKERETNQNVKQLQNDVKQQRAAKEDELEKQQKTIADLKTELRQLRNSVKESMDKMRAETEASSEATSRSELDRQRRLQDAINRLGTVMRNEKTVNSLVLNHTTSKIAEVEGETTTLTKRSSDQQGQREAEVHKLDKEREDKTNDLEKKRGERDMEVIEQEDRQRKVKATQEDKSARETLMNAKYDASTKLQAAVKGFFTRQLLVGLKKKFGKKKK